MVATTPNLDVSISVLLPSSYSSFKRQISLYNTVHYPKEMEGNGRIRISEWRALKKLRQKNRPEIIIRNTAVNNYDDGRSI